MTLNFELNSSFQLMRSVNSLGCLLSTSLRFTLVVENVAARTCALALQMMNLSDTATIGKVSVLIVSVLSFLI